MDLAPQHERPDLDAGEALVPRWVPYLFAALSVALAGGIARVFVAAPPLHLAQHWRLAWGGLDVAEAGLLAATGVALFVRSAVAEVLAAMTATLLCCDAWLDVLSSAGQGRWATAVAVAEAVLAELPLAVVLGWAAVRFARVVAAARPTLLLAGFRIEKRRLVPPADGYPVPRPARPDRDRATWRQWTYRGRARSWLLPWWLPAICVGLAVVDIPWIASLFVTLPSSQLARHWGLARVGFSLALAVVLAVSAVALLRRWPIAEVLVAAAAALLLRDAWFNVLTARRGHMAAALVVAAVLELPLAALCLWAGLIYARAVAVAWPFVRALHLRAVAERPRAGRGG